MQVTEHDRGGVTPIDEPEVQLPQAVYKTAVSELCRIERWFISLHASILHG